MEKEPDYLHPKLKQILEPTYGVIIYQERLCKLHKSCLDLQPEKQTF